MQSRFIKRGLVLYQLVSIRVHWWLVRLRREGGDNFFKTRVATKRIPPRHQFELAIGDATRNPGGNSELFASQIVVANPCGNLRQIPDHRLASDCVLFHWKKLDRAAAFAQCFLFPSESGVDQTKHTARRAVIWFGLHDLLL